MIKIWKKHNSEIFILMQTWHTCSSPKADSEFGDFARHSHQAKRSKKNEKLSSRNEMKFRFFQIPPTKIAKNMCVCVCYFLFLENPSKLQFAQKACKPRKFATSFRCWIGSCRHRSEIRTFFQRWPSNGFGWRNLFCSQGCIGPPST